MPGREIPLVTNEIYHVLNRGVASQPTFQNKKDYSRAIETFLYYQNKQVCFWRNKKLPLRYSKFLSLSNSQRAQILGKLASDKQFLAEIVAYCFMPNHLHFLLKQISENGISKFMSNFTNSYTRYFNTKTKRNGPLFQGKFKAIRVETDEQLLHLSRYIHLNPYSSYVIKNLKDLETYPYSSLPEYLAKSQTNFCSKEIILHNFKNKSSYQKFVFDQADYQRKLEEIKHLLLEE
jgi:putative transposase